MSDPRYDKADMPADVVLSTSRWRHDAYKHQNCCEPPDSPRGYLPFFYLHHLGFLLCRLAFQSCNRFNPRTTPFCAEICETVFRLILLSDCHSHSVPALAMRQYCLHGRCLPHRNLIRKMKAHRDAGITSPILGLV